MWFTRDARIVMKTLNKRYGDGQWEITAWHFWMDEVSSGPWNKLELDGKRFTVTSKYTQGKPFHVYVGAKHFVTSDCFLPTLYCMEYGVDYKFSKQKRERDDFSKLAEKISWISKYHYPYPDNKYYFTTGYYGLKDGFETVNEYQASALWKPHIVHLSPLKGVEPDLIPDEGRVYNLSEAVAMIEKFYCFSRKRNHNVDDKEFFDFVFDKNVTKEDIQARLKELAGVD